MIGFTKERIEQFIKNPLEHGLTRSEQMEMARQLLTSMEQEPVAFIDRANLDYLESGADADVWPASGAGSDDVLLYAAPQLPQPAVALTSGYSDFEEIWSSSTHPLTQDDEMKDFAWDIWNACRAAMLQGAEPVNQNDELPLDYLQGHKDGLEWSAQLAEANHPQTGDWLYDDPIELARAIRKGPDMPTAQDGNSPVTPDGWIPVSERMPNDKDFVWCWGYVSGWTESDGFEAYYDATRNKWWTIDDETVRKVTHWMPLPAAPLWE